MGTGADFDRNFQTDLRIEEILSPAESFIRKNFEINNENFEIKNENYHNQPLQKNIFFSCGLKMASLKESHKFWVQVAAANLFPQ